MPDSAFPLTTHSADASVATTLSDFGSTITAAVAPKASFVVAGIPVTAPMLQWLAVAAICMALAWIFARRRHTHIEPSMWWAAIGGVFVGRLVYLGQNWPAYALREGAFTGTNAHDASVSGSGVWSWFVQLIDLRDGGMSIGAGLAIALIVLIVAGWRRKGLRTPLAATVCAACVIWCGAGAALHVGAMGRPALPDWRFAALDARAPLAASTAVPVENVQLLARKRQPTVVNLWATWCGPCRREMPALARAQQAYPGVHIVFANQGENAAQVTAYLASAHLSLQNVVLDSDARLGARYRSSVVPTTLFFYADGGFADVHFGELSEPALHAVLDKLLAADRRG
ncbi:redoxin family protein [Robbsia sp. KACC 23696]|uniref:redoxin family protein n=1 Tax=Robbsia sp. KACC 23696 TaxID=3149231 RepID=UPI00325B0AAE